MLYPNPHHHTRQVLTMRTIGKVHRLMQRVDQRPGGTRDTLSQESTGTRT